MATKFLRRVPKSVVRAPAPPRRGRSYYLVAGMALDQELERLRALAIFADGPLATRRPELKVRRARKRPNRLGFAVPTEFRLSVTAYPGVRPGDVLETLLHELVHLHVGRAAEPHAWHGHTFKQTLAAAMKEAYEIAIRRPSSTRHGPYAEAIERARAGAASPIWSQRHRTGNENSRVMSGTDDGSGVAKRA
jgi:hypothetical protein